MSLLWDDQNEDHLLGEHDVTIADVEEVRQNKPRFFVNLPDRGGSHVMVGPDFGGRFYFVALAPTPIRGCWRPVTGWSMNRAQALKLYNRRNRRRSG